MADEIKTDTPQVSNAFDISKFNFEMNDDTGELEIKANKPVEKSDDSSSEETKEIKETIVPDRFTELDTKFSNQFSSVMDLLQRQSNAIGLLLQAQQHKIDSESEEDLGEENNKLVDSVVKKISQPISQLQQQIAPVVTEQQMQAELQQFQAAVPDAVQYYPIMWQISTAMPNHPWTLRELYVLAKNMNVPQKKDNVTDIKTKQQPQRELPDKVQSTNSQLKSKEIRSGRQGIKDAMEAAMEELGFGT